MASDPRYTRLRARRRRRSSVGSNYRQWQSMIDLDRHHDFSDNMLITAHRKHHRAHAWREKIQRLRGGAEG